MLSKYGYELVPDDWTASVEQLEYRSFRAPKLAGWTDVVLCKVLDGEHKGEYIVELLQGGKHPFLFVPESDIVKSEDYQ